MSRQGRRRVPAGAGNKRILARILHLPLREHMLNISRRLEGAIHANARRDTTQNVPRPKIT